MRVLHLANHGSKNVGNGALILGLERVLREDFHSAPSFVPEPWDSYSLGLRRFDEGFVARVNRDCDALLVGAAVTFDGRPPYGNTGMRFDLPLELWSSIRKPIVFYGLSHRDWRDRTNYHHLDRLRRTLELAVESRQVLFSVRNDGTKSWLESLTGVSSERILEAPDPAVYVPVEDAPHPELEEDKANVILSLNDEMQTTFREASAAGSSLRGALPDWRPRGWGRLSRLWERPPEWEQKERAVLAAIASAVRRLARDIPLNLVLCIHDYDDVWITGRFLTHLPARDRQVCVLASAGLPVGRAPGFYDLYAKCDAAIAMRVHAMTPAIGIGSPVVPLLSQRRMVTFMREAGLESLCVHVDEPALAGTILERVKSALADPERVRRALEAARLSLRERTAVFNRLVEDFVEG